MTILRMMSIDHAVMVFEKHKLEFIYFFTWMDIFLRYGFEFSENFQALIYVTVNATVGYTLLLKAERKLKKKRKKNEKLNLWINFQKIPVLSSSTLFLC